MPTASSSSSRKSPKQSVPTRRALGRGLSSLLPPLAAPAKAEAPAAQTGLRMLGIERITPNKDQPRKHFDAEGIAELAASIEAQGVLQPVVVRRHQDGFELVAGERRWRAAQVAKLKEIPAIVKDLSDERALQVALIENIQRRDLDPLEEAMAYQRLLGEHALRHEDLAKAVGKTRTSITHSLRLLRMPDELVAMVAQGALTPGHARALLTLDKNTQRKQLADETVRLGLSVAEVLNRAKHMQRSFQKQLRQSSKAAAAGDSTNLSLRDMEEKCQRGIGQKVRIILNSNKQQRGRIEISFDSFDQLSRIGDKLMD